MAKSLYIVEKRRAIMTIERTKNEIIIRIPDIVDPDKLQRLINYLVYQEATSKSGAEQEAVDQLSSEINKGWWEKNKSRFLKE